MEEEREREKEKEVVQTNDVKSRTNSERSRADNVWNAPFSSLDVGSAPRGAIRSRIPAGADMWRLRDTSAHGHEKSAHREGNHSQVGKTQMPDKRHL